MYKSKLQELCQKQKWALPTYTVGRADGPDHSPRFLASVTVNGIKFDAVDSATSSKEAQNKVAQMAFDHFAPTLPPPPPPAVNQLPYKSQLQIYAQKHLIDLPIYTAVRQGAAHAPFFRAQVVVGGKTFNGALSFKTLKEAENDVAKTALMFLQKEENDTTQDNMVSYKILLLELTQKERLGAPVYKTGSNGTSHMPLFSSIVEIGDDSFFGEVAKTKKQAEMNAAKVAWLNLKEKVNRDNEITTDNVSTSALLLSNLKIHQDTTEFNGFNDNKFAPKLNTMNPAREATKDANSSPLGNREALLKQTNFPAPSLPAHTANSFTDVVSAFPANYANSTFLGNRVRVYPRTPDLVLSEYETELPFSDDKWVAVSVDNPNHEVFHQGNGNAFDNNSSKISINRGSEVIEISSPRGINSSSSSESSVADNEILGICSSSSVKDGKFSLLSNRIAVYPNNSDFVLPEGVSKLPFSDDKWVGLCYDI